MMTDDMQPAARHCAAVDPADADGNSSFSFVALPTEPGIPGPISPSDGGIINLSGQLSSDGVDARLDGLRLENWPGDFVPSGLLLYLLFFLGLEAPGYLPSPLRG